MHLPNNTLLQGGKYKIVRFISSGGFGCTYEAYDTVNNKTVAIKELFVRDLSDRDEVTQTINAYSSAKSVLLAKVRKKFMDEANALKSMNHPHIVKVYDSFEENGTAYYVMDYIDGESLQEMVNRKGALDENVAVGYILEIADALKYVHSLNRLHLDIKPGNIMIDHTDKAVLIDFGVSKQYDEANGENTSTLLGRSVGYSPIEQLGSGVQSFTPATDIYALGATLYKLVTGDTPPDATSVLSNGLPALPVGLKNSTKDAITKSMKPRKEERPQNISAYIRIITRQIPSQSRRAAQQKEKQEGLNILAHAFAFLLCIGHFALIHLAAARNIELGEGVDFLLFLGLVVILDLPFYFADMIIVSEYPLVSTKKSQLFFEIIEI